MNLYIKGGRLVDPSQALDELADLWIEDGRIVSVLKDGKEPPRPADRTIDARGKAVAPGFIDVHVHFREPGQLEKEDIESGTRAAVAGGVTTAICMPNTRPTNDSVATTQLILERVEKTAHCRVYPVGAITEGLRGEKLTPMKALKKAGCVAFSDDGRPVNNASLMRQALEEAQSLDVTLMEHCEELTLSRSATVNEGEVAKALGVKGIPISAETVDLVRTIVLASETGTAVHLAHVSTKASVELIREFKAAGAKVTAEVTPHHLLLTDEAIKEHGTNAKMYPPLRGEADREALVKALREGIIDVIATDHAPHTEAEKKRPFAEAPNGIIGLETALPVLLTLVNSGELSLSTLVERFSTRPATLLGLKGGTLAEGSIADVVIFSLEEERVLVEKDLYSRSRNTPFLGFRGRGKVYYTLVGGKEVFPGGDR